MTVSNPTRQRFPTGSPQAIDRLRVRGRKLRQALQRFRIRGQLGAVEVYHPDAADVQAHYDRFMLRVA